jgi:hypothetical protein
MKFTENNALQFYHYSASLNEALRTMLNTEKFDDADQEYWTKSLKEFQIIIADILGSKNTAVGSSDLFIKEVHHKFFGKILNAYLQQFPNQNQTDYGKGALISQANKLAKQCILELYGVEL